MADESLTPTIQDLYEQDELARLHDDADAFEEQHDRERLAARRAKAPAGVGAFALPTPTPQAQPQGSAQPPSASQVPAGVGAFGLPHPKPGEAAASGTLGDTLSQAGQTLTEQLHLQPDNLDAAKGRQGLTLAPDSPQGMFLRNTLGALKGAQAGAMGFVGMLEANLEQLIGIRTPAGRWALKQAEQLEAQAKALTPDDPLFLDKFVQTAAVQLPLFAVGMGVQGLTAALTGWVGRYGPRLAPWVGASVSGITEAALEAGNAYTTLLEFYPPEEATRRANEIFWHNAALLAITNRLGVFNDRLPLLMKLPVAMVGEAGQELAQTFRIERDGLAVPVDHPKAALLRANGWVEVEQPRRTMHTDVFSDTPDSERVLKFPIQWKDVRDIAAISAILGGMGGMVETAVTPDDLPGGGGRTPPATPAEAEAFLQPGEFGFVASEAAQARAEAQAPESAVRDSAGGLTRVFPLGEAGAVQLTPETQAPGETQPAPDEGHPLPESQVVDAQGNLQRVFHGTTASFAQFDAAKQGSGAGGDLYGPGFYFTEAPEVAGGTGTTRSELGYATPSGVATPVPLAEHLTFEEAKTFVQDKGYIADPSRLSIMHPQRVDSLGPPFLAHNVRIEAETDIFGDNPTFRVTQRQHAAQPNVRPAYLDIRNPFDMEVTIPFATVQELLEKSGVEGATRDADVAMAKRGVDAEVGMPGSRVYEILRKYQSKEAIQQTLQTAGFDGITHTGGAVTGGKPHRVWIAFTPEQVIPAFDLMQQLRERQARGQRGALDLSSDAQARLPKLPLTITITPVSQSPEQIDGYAVRWEHPNGNARNRVLPSYQEALQFAADFQADFDVTMNDHSPIKPEGGLPRPRVGFEAFGRTPNRKQGTAPVRPYPTVEELESGQGRLDLLGNERGAIGRLPPTTERQAEGAGLIGAGATSAKAFGERLMLRVGDLSKQELAHVRQKAQAFFSANQRQAKGVKREGMGPGMPTVEQLYALYEQAEFGADWYVGAREEVERIVGPEDAVLFLQILAATSPSKRVHNNITVALKAYVFGKLELPLRTGQPSISKKTGQESRAPETTIPGLMGSSDLLNVEQALRRQPLSGRKVNTFFQNLLGDPTGVTVDVWMTRLWGLERSSGTVSDKQYVMIQTWVQDMAQRLGVAPRDMQAGLWVAYKLQSGALHGEKPSDIAKPLRELLRPNIDRALVDLHKTLREQYPLAYQAAPPLLDRLGQDGTVRLATVEQLGRFLVGAGIGASLGADDEERIVGAFIGAGLNVMGSRSLFKQIRGFFGNIKYTPQATSLPSIWQQILGDERGSVNLFGQEQPDDIPDPAVPPELAAEGGAQPSPEQLGLGGIPQQSRFQLPPDLAQAQPRLGSVPLDFVSDMDKALYILGNAQNRSAADSRYLQEVMDFTRQPEADVRKQAAARRQAIVAYARPRGEAGVPLRIPDLSQGEAQTAPSLQAQPGEAAQPLLTGLQFQDARDAQGLPLLSPDTVESLRDFLRLQETDQETSGKPRDVNFKMVQTDEGVKKVLAAVSEVYLEEIDTIRQHKTRDEVRTEALNMGMTIEQFLQLDREEIVSRKKAALSQEFLVAGARQLKVAQALWRNGNLSGRDFLRVFAIQVAIQSQTARLKNESGGAQSQLARPVEGELFSLRGFESIMEYLGSQNISAELLDGLLGAAQSPEQLEMVLEQLPDATGAQMLRELFYGLYLFSFTPHVANIVSNFGLLGDGYLSRVAAAWSGGTPLTLEDALLRAQAGKDSNLTREQQQRLQADPAALFARDLVHGEANAYLWGVTHAVIDGLKLASRSAKAGVSMFEEEILKGRTGENIIDASLGRRMGALTTQNVRGNLQGNRVGRAALSLSVGQRGLTPLGSAFDVLGKLFTLSGRGLLAEDAFFKFLHYQGEKHAHAWRKAVLDGTAVDPQTGTFRKRADVFAEMQRFVENPPPEVRRLAMERANAYTLTKDFSELGVLGRALGGGLDQLARGSVVGMLIFPFMRIAANAADYSLQRLPLVSLLQDQVRADLRAGGARAKMRKGQLAMGHLLFGVAALFAGLGLIRGSGPDDPDAKRLKRATGWEPYTIVVPGTSITVTYDRLEPFAQSIAIAADLMDAYPEVVNDPFNYQEWLELAAAGGLAFADNIFQKSYAEGMENLTELVLSKEGTPEGRKLKWERFMLRLSRGLVPSGLGRVETALDPRLNEVRTHLDAWRSRLPKASDGLSVQRDYWGDAIELSTTGYGIDIFNPYTVAVDKGLAFGPPSVDTLRSALAAKDQERLKVWVSQIMLANNIVFHRPSQFLVRNTRDKDPALSDVDDAIRLPPEAHERLQVLFAQEVTDSQGRPLVEGMAARILEDDWLRDLNQAGRERALRQVHELYLGKAEATLRRETEADPTLPWYGEVMRALQVQRIRRTRTREQQSEQLGILEQLQQQLEISR